MNKKSDNNLILIIQMATALKELFCQNQTLVCSITSVINVY